MLKKSKIIYALGVILLFTMTGAVIWALGCQKWLVLVGLLILDAMISLGLCHMNDAISEDKKEKDGKNE